MRLASPLAGFVGIALAAATLAAATLAGPAATATVEGESAAHAVSTTPQTGLRIGSWDVNLTPFLAGQDAVVDQVAASDLDVLALQGVWSPAAEAALLADPRIQAKYPYSYVTPAAQAPGSIPYTPDVAGPGRGQVRPQVTRLALESFIDCLISTGTDTRTVITPASPINGLCTFFGLNINLESQTAYSTLVATMQTVPEGDPGAYTAIDEGFTGTGVLYGYDGRPGQLILSADPILDPQNTTFDTDLVRRDNVVATIDGVKIAFGNWPINYLADIDPSLGPLQQGALQPDLATQALAAQPDLIVGSLNTGPDYQPDAYRQLQAAGYRPSSHAETYCPDGAAGFSRCEGQSPRATDNVFFAPDMRCTPAGTFATDQTSEHLGVSTRCAPPPTVTGVAPAIGPSAGGETVTITGSGFTGATEVRFGHAPASDFTVDSDTQITAVTPAHRPALAHVRVRALFWSDKDATNRYRWRRE